MSNLIFGGLPVPGSGVVLANLDLNDKVTWYNKEFVAKPAVLIETARQNWRGQSSRLAGDRNPLTIDLPFVYDESGAGRLLATDHAKLSQSGEQWLKINATQHVLVEFLNLQASLQRPGSGSKVYAGVLSFLARKGYAEDIAASSFGPQALGGSVSPGTQTNFSIAYGGSVLTRPVWTLTIPNTNTVTITSFKLQNTLSGEVLTLNFSTPLAANTAYTLTIDCDAYTVKDGSGTNYDPLGSFPKLYPPAGTSNTFTATVVTGSGTSTGITLSASYSNRWEVQA